MSEKEILAKTVYLEARGEIRKGWRAVAFVIMTRVKRDKDYWGGNTVKGVCFQKRMFECWNADKDKLIGDSALYRQIKQVTDRIYDGDDTDDPTFGSDHYKERKPGWTANCIETVKIGNHQFYKSK